MENIENKPCLVNTSQGFSVSYKSKYLYSKYNPQKNILNIIDSLEILPDTLILCFSAVMDYGVKKLLEISDNSCKLVLIEKDENLSSFSFTQNEKIIDSNEDRLIFVSPDFQKEFIISLNNNKFGFFKRVIKIDFSAGVQFNYQFYSDFFILCQNIVNQFWKNRITLTKFGRLYNSNVLKNLSLLPFSNSFFKVNKPLLVIGAGESALQVILKIKEFRNKFYILCVDAALKTLKSVNLKPDAVICEESQSIISLAFTGCKDFYDSLFLSLSSNHQVAKINPEKNYFYCSKFANTEFLEKLEKNKFADFFIEPLGSVGLSAVQIALKLREGENVPIFVCGLDFSFSIGKTHISSSFHENQRRKDLNRLKSIENFSCFSDYSFSLKDFNNVTCYSNKALFSYSELFIDRFSKEKNIFNLGKSGLDLKIPCVSSLENFSYLYENEFFDFDNDFCASKKNNLQNEISFFLDSEKKSLVLLKDILTGKIELEKSEMEEKIVEMLKPREYLYLHFPDGYKMDISLGFLKRIRAEIDYFLKLIDLYD